ncbi:hypothetical protein [Phaeocystidibacter luteus]|uniref:Uncharacterized protein n=1 Tax=Phaeocystidibacter luteus TaxID=911197 RepID=A0A6N6RJT1_9FLAO|nr:hypothetical protein [Phaeocystidibacter luteus]KAB2814017.1 hypothetical protein F8C67_04880 [Phaeocystidibacter luteus]
MSDQETLEIAKLQGEIESYLNLGSTSIIFDYQDKGKQMRLDVITVNPRHDQSFLFQSSLGYDKVDVLKKMFDYVKTYKEKENTYTIQWAMREKEELHTSYFRAKDIPEAIDKLHYGRDPNGIVIFSVVMNPIS